MALNPAPTQGEGARSDRTKRRIRRGPVLTAASTDPAVIGGIDPEDALPGELQPLTWHEGRGPVTDEEALGVLRRRRRVDLARQSQAARDGAEIPEELPEASERKVGVVFRLPPRALARAHARAEIEETNLTAVFEAFLLQYSQGKPQDPQTVAERQLASIRRAK